MPSTSELSPIVTSQASASAGTAEPARVGLQPLDIVKRHIKLFAIVSGSLLLLGVMYLQIYLRPIYEATAIVYVSPIFPAALSSDHDHDRQYDAFLEQQITAATRYETLQKALRKYPDAWPAAFPGESEQNKILRLQKQLKVEQVGRSYEVSISLQGSKAEQLPDFVNQITADYLEDARNEEVYGREQKLETLHQQKAELQKQLDADLAQQGQILQYVGLAHLSDKGANPYDESLSKLRDELGDAHAKSVEADADLRSLSGGSSQSAALQQAAIDEVAADPVVSGMKAQLSTRKATLMTLISGMKPGNPIYSQSEAEIADIDRRLDQITRDATKKAAVHIEQKAISAKTRAAGLEKQLSSDLARTTSQASTAAPKLQQAQVLSAEIDRLLANQTVINNRIQDLMLEGETPGSIHLFSSALPVSAPVKRKAFLAYAVVLLFSLAAGTAAALLKDKLDPHIYTSLDVRRLVGFPPIGLLLSATEFSPDLRREYFLRLAGGLDQAHRRTGARTFVFPSVGPKSSRDIVEQLGAELSANGLRVLVVNIQSGKSPDKQAPEKFGPQVDIVPPNPRLLTMTDGQTQMSTEVDKEQYRVISLPATEVSELLRRSRSYYNAILVAADPLFTSAYTEHFARTADGTVLIVDSGETRKDELIRAARLLERLKISGIAIVLNGVSERRAEEDVARTLADYKRNAA